MELEQLSNTHQVNLMWGLEHSVVEGNEEIDKLAWRGIEIDFLGQDPAMGLLLLSVKKKVPDFIHQKRKRH